MNSTTKARLRGRRLCRKPQMLCANTAQSSAGTKYTAAAARRKVAGSLMAPTCPRAQVLCQRPLAQRPTPRAAPEPASGNDCLTAYASRRPTAYTAAALAGAPGGRPAHHAPRAASDLQRSWVPGRRSRQFRRRRGGPRLARSVNVRADARGGLMEASITLRPGYALPEEEQIAATYQHLLRRLSHQSVVKHFDAYADIDWDAADYRIDPEDPRWELGGDDVLGATAWYRAQPQATRARLGLHLVATKMKIGTQFENVLQRGLLEFAWTLPNGAPEFRYVYHEVIEEGQHSLMFQEFVNRTGFDVAGLGFWDRLGARRVIAAARRLPALFFVFVLGGEDPIDHVQRTALRSAQPIHPLLRRIMQIHVTEEARHLCFARSYLRTEVPRLGAARRASLALQAPLVLGQMAQAMLRPSADVVRTHGIPAAVIAEAYTRNPRHRENTLAALAKLRDLCRDVGIVTPWSVRLWRAAGIWAE